MPGLLSADANSARGGDLMIDFEARDAETTAITRVDGSMSAAFFHHLSSELDGLKSAGLYKSERVITSKQAAEIEVAGGQRC